MHYWAIYLQLQHIAYILNNNNYTNYGHFANMKGTVNGNWLPSGKQVKKFWEPLT